MKINLQKMIAGVILITSTMSVFAAPKFNSKKSISVLSREDGRRRYRTISLRRMK